jgi:hypothetical protein
MLEVVLSNPLSEPEIETTSTAVTPTLPPTPSPVVLLRTWAPLARLRLFTFNEILPASPAPSVAAEIVPPSLIAKIGVETATSPAFPVPEAVLNNPLP